MARTRSTSILDLEVGDVVIPHTAEYQEWPVKEITDTGRRNNPIKITWGNGETTHHSAKARFSVKAS
jgi:hypothetical protein